MSQDPERNAEEAELIRRVLAGETELFRLLIERYQREIYALIVRQVGDYALSEDLTQDCFLRAFKALPKFRFAASFRTWLTRIALNVTHSYFTSRNYKQRENQIPLEPERHDQSAEPYDTDTERNLARLRKAIGALSEKYQSVVVLCILEERTYQEAADTLEIPIGTVGSRINKALALLHEELLKMGEP